MELFLKNIGRIGEAAVTLHGITVIAGKNDTGKSTVGKAFFSVLNGFHRIDALNATAKAVPQSILEQELNAVFHGQVQNLYSESDSKIELKLDDKTASIQIKSGHIAKIELSGSDEWHTNVFYNLQAWNPALLLRRNYNRNCTKTERIHAILSKVCDVQTEQNGRTANLKSLSPSLKSFFVLKALLQYSLLKNNSVLLLDEPETHLHPERQLLYAELLVLLHTDLGVRVLLNTHSHYFLNAIEIYSQKYGVADQCRFYLSSLNGDFATMTDVTENTERIYQEFAHPLQQLENERYRILPFAV